MEVDLQNDRDPYRQLPNLRAVLSAYRRGTLEWCEGLVTYWANGRQLCQPRPFDWDELEAINAKHNDVAGFWTEGVRLFLSNLRLLLLLIKHIQLTSVSPKVDRATQVIPLGSNPWVPRSHSVSIS